MLKGTGQLIIQKGLLLRSRRNVVKRNLLRGHVESFSPSFTVICEQLVSQAVLYRTEQKKASPPLILAHGTQVPNGINCSCILVCTVYCILFCVCNSHILSLLALWHIWYKLGKGKKKENTPAVLKRKQDCCFSHILALSAWQDWEWMCCSWDLTWPDAIINYAGLCLWSCPSSHTVFSWDKVGSLSWDVRCCVHGSLIFSGLSQSCLLVTGALAWPSAQRLLSHMRCYVMRWQRSTSWQIVTGGLR